MSVHFPIFEKLSIRDYDLYPGKDGSGGLDFEFKGDENLVIGVNGLGKSTLLLLLKHMIEGAVRLRSPGFVGERQPDWTFADSTTFAVRASNGSPNATAELTVRFGEARLRIKRKLRDLSLLSYAVKREGEDLAKSPMAQWFWADTRQQLPGLGLAQMALLLAMAANVGVSTMVSSFRLTFVGFLDQRLSAELYVDADAVADRVAFETFLATRTDAVLP
ncbi:MAG TPA: hypothetical protein VGN98_13645, partial [Tianweitania sediminis]|nr:hypothetical protein [Tianweitania sediminis]